MTTKLSRAAKAAKRLRGVETGVGLNAKTAIHVVNVYAKVPVVLSGFLVSIDKDYVRFRHRKSGGSKKTRLSTFPRADVIEVFGTVGEHSQITIWRRNLVSSVRGYLKTSASKGAIQITSLNDETTVFYFNDNIELEIYADEDDKGQRVPKRKKLKSKTKAKTRRDEEDEGDEEEESEDGSEHEDFEQEETEEEEEEESENL